MEDQEVRKAAEKLQEKYGVISASLLQRELKIGYTQAREIVQGLKGSAAPKGLTKEVKAAKISRDKKIPKEVEVSRADDEPENEEETEMAKKAVKKTSKKEGAEKVGGLFRAGTALAYLYELFEDGKTRSNDKVKGDLRKKKFSKTEEQAEWRIRRFREAGEKSGTFALTRDGDDLQLKFGKAKPKASKPAKKVSAKKAVKKGAGKPASSVVNGSDKRQKSLQALVRRTVASSDDDMTKNKVVDVMKKTYGTPSQDTLTAIKAEITRGGMKDEGGVLSLV